MLYSENFPQEEWQKSISDYTEKLLNDEKHIECLMKFANFLAHNRLDNDYGRRYVSDLVQSIANVFGIEIKNIVLSSHESTRGAYQKETKSLFLRTNYENVAQLLTTIYHEMRHALQLQKFVGQDNEIGRLLKDDLGNYVVPGSDLMGDIDYLTNFAEEDANAFSFVALEKLLGKIICLGQAQIKQDFKEIKESKTQIISSANQNKDLLNQVTVQLIKGFGDAFVEMLKARGDQKKIDKRFDRKMKVLQESYKQVEQYLPRDEIYSQIIVYVFDNCSLEDIVRNLNNPNMAILNAMENSLPPSLRTRNYPKIQGDMDDNHFDWLKKQVGAMKEVLAEFKIPFDKKDDGRAFMTFLDYAGKLYAEVFKREAKSKSKPQDEKIKSLIFKLTTYKIIDSKKLLQYAINKYGMKKITSWFDKKKEESGELDIADYRLLDFERASSKMQEEKEENKKFKIIPLDKENENDL